MRILVCTPKYAPQVGGAETWLRALLDALAARDHDVAVVSRAAAGIPDEQLIGEVSVRRVDGGRLAFGRGIGRALAAFRPDVVLAHYSALPPAVWGGHRAGVPVVGIVHDVYGLRESIRIKGPAVGLLRHAGLERSLRWLTPDAFFVNSDATAARLRPLARGRAVTVIPAGADHLPVFEGSAPRSGADVVFVGRLVKQKGAADLVDALTRLRRGGRRIRAVIIGTGPQAASLRAAAASIGDAVTFAGRVSDQDLDATIRSAALLALPSTREGWGLAITEAAARGVPYVAYDIPAVREQHEVLRGGVLVDPDPASLAAAIGKLLDDPSGRARLGETGRERAATLTWARSAVVAEEALGSVVRAAVAGGSR